jgi:hypothetical protein
MKGIVKSILQSGLVWLICFGLFNLQPTWAAGNIDSTYKYAWSENSGWQNFRPTDGGVTVYSTYLSGYAWAENIGWVKLGSGTGPYANTGNANWGVNHNNATGALSGYAWSENAGWINFNPSDSQVVIDTTTLKFEGYAWAENVGYIHFQNASPEYYVKQEPRVPSVTTQAVTGISTTAADGNGNITDLGSTNPTGHGFCWNTTGTPTIGDSFKDIGAASATGVYTSDMTGLSPKTTYYVRAYATNTAGTSYGNQVSFTTSTQAPTVTTQAVTAIGTTMADGNGNITDLGAPDPTQHGVCWNTSGTPTTADSKTEKGAASATGAFASHMTGLSPNTIYYVRAYATNTAGTSYGTQVSFTTRAAAATVTTQAVSAIGATTATGNGNITDLGSPAPTQHGVCWNTAGTPTTGDNKTEEGPASATGAFTSNLTGLSPTTYYVRAYVIDAVGTIYGNQVSFTTSAGAPTVTTEAMTSIDKTTATGHGNITDLGFSNPTQHGVCWNTTGTPTTADSKTEDGPSSATGAFSSLVTGLRPGTDYYVRAYATNTGGTSYGNQISFTSAGKMATGYPHSYKVTLTKVEMYNGTSWVTIFSGTAQLDMVPGGTFPGISDLSLPAGTYSQVRITFKNSFPVTGTLSHGGTAYYTTATTFEGQTNLDSNPTTVAGNMAEFTFYEPAWGALNADVTQTYSITPVAIGPGTDYQPTLRFTVSTTFNLNESAAPSSTEYFTLGVPPVNVVEP